jgi:VWFA-related protein
MIHRWMVWLVILIAAGETPAAAQQTTFSVEAEEVRIDVLVTERGKPVAGLSASDFEIFDNGIPQEIQYATLQRQTPISATLVFDMSRSVAGQLLINLKEAARALLTDFKNDDYAALITFNNAVTLGSPPTHDFARIELALDSVQPFGNSSLIDGSYAGLILAESRPELPLLIIFSDGRDTFSWLTSEAVLETAKSNDTVVAYAVSTERLENKGFLSDLTGITGGSLFEIESTRNLAAVFLGILEEFRQRYLVTYTPRGVSGGGWHTVDVRIKNRAARVSARPGYTRSTR